MLMPNGRSWIQIPTKSTSFKRRLNDTLGFASSIGDFELYFWQMPGAYPVISGKSGSDIDVGGLSLNNIGKHLNFLLISQIIQSPTKKEEKSFCRIWRERIGVIGKKP